MKREGRQHGTVRIPKEYYTKSKGVMYPMSFIKAPTKPTNKSKDRCRCKRVRCRQCHSSPLNKSKYKEKGAYKLRCTNVAFNHHLASWRLVDGRVVHFYDDDDDDENEDEHDDMEFCEIGFVWDYLDEEGWCVVDEV